MNNILFKINNFQLLCSKEDLSFIYNDEEYKLTSQPYEPCLYIKKNDIIKSIIHNSFNTYDIIETINNNEMFSSISGNKYDIKTLVEIMKYIIDNNISECNISDIEDKINIKEDIFELKDDIFYKEYKKYDESVIEYFILKNNSSYNSKESHKKMIIYCINKLKSIYKKEYDMDIKYDIDKIKMHNIKTNLLFDTSSSNNKSYCYYFLNPPHTCSYNTDDFNKLNNLLFPKGKTDLEIYECSTDWSNYFDEGNEWWGTMCISIYDKRLDRFVVILASSTD